MSPASHRRAEAWAKEAIQNMPLDELRAAMELTQENLSNCSGCPRAAF
jgi:hypothetical protein